MSIEFAYVVGSLECSLLLADTEIWDRLIERYPEECNQVFGVDEPDEYSFDTPEAQISAADLLAAVNDLLQAFKANPDLSPRRFLFDFEYIPGLPISGHDEVNGVRVNWLEGVYHLKGGVGGCVLREFRTGSGVMPEYGDPIDVSDRSVIETESHGPIKVRCRKQTSPFARDLRKLRKFLMAHANDVVTKQLR
jgi:hypothetical protein